MRVDRLREVSLATTQPNDLTSFLEADGYLFFRDVLDPSAVDRVAAAFAASLWRQGGSGGIPRWDELVVENVDSTIVTADVPRQGLIDDPATRELCRTILGSDPHVFPIAPLRWMLPSHGEFLLPPHQDIAYLGPEDQWRIFWVPLVDARDGLGGVAISPGSHRTKTIFAHVQHGSQTSQTTGQALYGIADEERFEPWASAEFRVGDILVLDPYMVHRSLPNCAPDRVRLSMDFRAQPLEAPRGVDANRVVPAVRTKAEIFGAR